MGQLPPVLLAILLLGKQEQPSESTLHTEIPDKCTVVPRITHQKCLDLGCYLTAAEDSYCPLHLWPVLFPQSKGTLLLLGDLLTFVYRRCFCAFWSAHKPPPSTCYVLAVHLLAAMAQAAPNAAAAEGGDWKARLNLPPKDTRIRTEVSLCFEEQKCAGRCLAPSGMYRIFIRRK